MKTLSQTLVLAIALLSFGAACNTPDPPAGSAATQLNTSRSGLALEGYDPVAYFPAGGGVPLPGDPALSVEWNGASYRFANEANRDTFLSNPVGFTPAYGGWCAWAMADNDKVEIDPGSFLIEGGRLLVFYDGFFADTRESWLESDRVERTRRADQHWAEFLGATAQATDDGARAN